MHAVESTAIDAIGYNAEARVLQVRFVSGGDYRYFNVPAEIAAAFDEAVEGPLLSRAGAGPIRLQPPGLSAC